jgi:6-phosphogluconate dehydrogenase (decarboxylating)
MQIGTIGLGRMGANMARRLLRAGHQCVVFDTFPKAVLELSQEKAEADYQDKLLSAMRFGFGGHLEKSAK